MMPLAFSERFSGKLARRSDGKSVVMHWFTPITPRRQSHGSLLMSFKVQQDGSDSEDFLFGKLRIDRERETLLTQNFSNREIASSVTEMGVGLLQMNRHWIVDGRLDAGSLQVRAHPLAFWSFNHITMPHALGIGHKRRQRV